MPDARQIKAGEIIFKEGDKSDVAYHIASGKIEILKKANHGDVQLATLEQGVLFGEMGLFDDTPRSATARAAVDSTVDVITRNEISAMLGQTPQPLQMIIHALIDRLRNTNVRASQTQKAETIVECDYDNIIIQPKGEALSDTFEPITVNVSQLPFHIGGFPEADSSHVNPINHLNLPSEGPPLIISRHHLTIEVEENTVYVLDRGSRYGTVLDGRAIGKGRGRFKAPLDKGEHTLLFGDKHSPYGIGLKCA